MVISKRDLDETTFLTQHSGGSGEQDHAVAEAGAAEF
jgi:hypothetical protein